jgi:hypothetical protein
MVAVKAVGFVFSIFVIPVSFSSHAMDVWRTRMRCTLVSHGPTVL